MTTMTTNPKDRFLAGDGPVVALIAPFARGAADWETTRDGLIALTYAEVPKATTDQLMGKDGGQHYPDTEPGDDPVVGSWGEVLRAKNYGILDAAQVQEVLAARVAA